MFLLLKYCMNNDIYFSLKEVENLQIVDISKRRFRLLSASLIKSIPWASMQRLEPVRTTNPYAWIDVQLCPRQDAEAYITCLDAKLRT